MPLGEGGSHKLSGKRGTPHKRALFYHYWLF